MAVKGEAKHQTRPEGLLAAVEGLLRQWGQERAAPALEAPVRSLLGDTSPFMGGGRSSGGGPGLGMATLFAQYSRVCLVVEDVLCTLSDPREAGGLGGYGARLCSLARVRYLHSGPPPPIARQLAELAISERTYRRQLAELHRAVAERLERRLREADRAAWRSLSAPG